MNVHDIRPVGLFGGTFDPIHHGHLRLAVELRECLGLREMRLIPNALPPHRDDPGAAPAQRLRWIRAAIAGEPGLVLDDRELRRGGRSYTVDTLASLREELPDTPLCLVLGMDTFLGLELWQRWRELIDLAHIVVAPRPGVTTPDTGELGDLVRAHAVSDPAALRRRAAGGIYRCDATPLAISSTDIRNLLQAGRSVRYLVPDVVWRDIQSAEIYSEAMDGNRQVD